MKSLYLTWQNLETQTWCPVGQLSKQQDVYRFVYTHGALSSDFFHLGRMSDLRETYYSRELFPSFANRILNRSRPEYSDYLRWLGFNHGSDSFDDMQLLARSGGRRATDDLSVYPDPVPNENGQRELFFLSHGIRSLQPAELDGFNNLQVAQPLLLSHNQCSAIDEQWLLQTEGNIKVGYGPSYLTQVLNQIIEKTDMHVSVASLNQDAPAQFRLLCRVVFELPAGDELFTNAEYQPVTPL